MAPELWSAADLAAAYLLGSVPFALWIGRGLGIDIRRVGSGNVGATNLSRAAGRKWGITAFLLDFSKGLLAVLLGFWTEERGLSAQLLGPRGLGLLCGLAAILGHVFPLYLGFRGGKGVATTFGVMTGLSWIASAIAGAVWLAVYLATRTVSIASICAALALPAAAALFERGRADGYPLLCAFAGSMAALIIWRHRSNIARLLRGDEHSFGVKNGAKK